jgi:hypothetical protein
VTPKSKLAKALLAPAGILCWSIVLFILARLTLSLESTLQDAESLEEVLGIFFVYLTGFGGLPCVVVLGRPSIMRLWTMPSFPFSSLSPEAGATFRVQQSPGYGRETLVPRPCRLPADAGLPVEGIVGQAPPQVSGATRGLRVSTTEIKFGIA